MAAERGNEFNTIRNPAIGQLGCDFLYVERDPAMFYLPSPSRSVRIA